MRLNKDTTRSGKFLGHTSCAKCGSKDNMAVYEASDKTVNGYCFGCETYQDFGTESPEIVDFPNTKQKIASQKSTNLEHLAGYPCLDHRDRGIPKELVEFYGIRSKVIGNVETARYYPYYMGGKLSGYKVRTLPKKFHAVGTISGNIMLFGQQLFNHGKMVIITAGEDDAIAAYRMTKWVRSQEEWRRENGKNIRGKKGSKGVPAVSLPRGAKDLRAIKDNLEWLERFDTVVFAVDQEDLDIDAAQEAIKLLTPGKGKIARFELKDASEMCKAKRFREFYNSLFDAVSQKPGGIIESAEEIWEAFQKRDMYTPIPYPKSWGLDKCPGLYFPALVTLIGGTGVGKSSIVRELQLHLFESTNYSIGVVSMEDSLTACAGTLIGMKIQKRVMSPDVAVPEEELKTANQELFGGGRFVFCDSTGVRSENDLFNKIRFMANSRDCKVVFLDHLTAILDRMGHKSDKGQVQYTDALVAALNELVQELGICIVLVAHVRKTAAGKATENTFETGALPTEDSIKGSGSIKQYSYSTLAIARDKTKEDSPTFIYVLKDRLVGWTGRSAPLFFNYDTGRYEPFVGGIEEDAF